MRLIIYNSKYRDTKEKKSFSSLLKMIIEQNDSSNIHLNLRSFESLTRWSSVIYVELTKQTFLWQVEVFWQVKIFQPVAVSYLSDEHTEAFKELFESFKAWHFVESFMLVNKFYLLMNVWQPKITWTSVSVDHCLEKKLSLKSSMTRALDMPHSIAP